MYDLVWETVSCVASRYWHLHAPLSKCDNLLYEINFVNQYSVMERIYFLVTTCKAVS